MHWGQVRCSEGGVRASHRPQSTAQRPRRQDSTPRRVHMASEHGVCTTHEPLPRPADRRDRTARLTRSTRWAPVVDARRPEQLQSCNAIVAPAHVGGWTEGIRRVFMWAEARFSVKRTSRRSGSRGEGAGYAERNTTSRPSSRGPRTTTTSRSRREVRSTRTARPSTRSRRRIPTGPSARRNASALRRHRWRCHRRRVRVAPWHHSRSMTTKSR